MLNKSSFLLALLSHMLSTEQKKALPILFNSGIKLKCLRQNLHICVLISVLRTIRSLYNFSALKSRNERNNYFAQKAYFDERSWEKLKISWFFQCRILLPIEYCRQYFINKMWFMWKIISLKMKLFINFEN